MQAGMPALLFGEEVFCRQGCLRSSLGGTFLAGRDACAPVWEEVFLQAGMHALLFGEEVFLQAGCLRSSLGGVFFPGRMPALRRSKLYFEKLVIKNKGG